MGSTYQLLRWEFYRPKKKSDTRHLKNLNDSSSEFNRVCNTSDQVNVPCLSASHFLSWSTCGVLERGRNNTPRQPFCDAHGRGNPS